VTREELYKKVWSVPGSRLALYFGISDVGLAKICRRYGIPRPPRGYWARLAAGQKLRKPPLLKVSNPRFETVYLKGADMPDDAIRPIMATNPRARATPPSPVPDAPLHPLVEVARQQLTTATPDAEGLVCTDPAFAPSVRVAPATVDRALRLLNLLVKQWEANGGYVKPRALAGGPPTETAIGIEADSFGLRVAETINEHKPLTDSTRRTGYVGFYIEGDEQRQFRRRWAETKSQNLERMISPLVETLVHALAAKRVDRLDQECRNRQQQRIKTLRTSAAQKGSQAFYRRQDLIQEVDRWYEAERVRAYLQALQDAVAAGKIGFATEDAYRRWMEWALQYADSIDPLVRLAHPQETAAPPISTPVDQLDVTSGLRAVLERLGAKDSDELWHVPKERLQQACSGKFGNLWNEITRVLEGLGYDVSKREEAYAWQ
jgi:hypothetical protein